MEQGSVKQPNGAGSKKKHKKGAGRMGKNKKGAGSWDPPLWESQYSTPHSSSIFEVNNKMAQKKKFSTIKHGYNLCPSYARTSQIIILCLLYIDIEYWTGIWILNWNVELVTLSCIFGIIPNNKIWRAVFQSQILSWEGVVQSGSILQRLILQQTRWNKINNI